MSNKFLKQLPNKCFLALLGMLLFPHLEITGWASPLQEGSAGTLRVDVDLVTVEVIVQDKKGTPILGLKREDFRLYDDGKLQQIVTFDAVADSGDKTVPTSLTDIDESKRGKVVLILFDDSNIMPQQIKLSRDVATAYVKQHMRPWDLFAVADYGLSLRVSQTFTHDITKVMEAIQLPAMSHALQVGMQSQISDLQDPNLASGQGQVSGQFPGQVSGQRAGRAGSQNLPGQSNTMSSEAKYRGMVYLRTLNTLSASISRIKGRKIILMFSEDFKLSSELQSELQSLINVSQKSNVAYYTVDSRGLNVVQPTGFGSQSFLPQQRLETRGQGNHQLSTWHGLVRLLFPAIDLLKPDPAALFAANFFQARGGGQSGGQAGGGSQGGSSGGGSTTPGQGGGQPASGATGPQGNYTPFGQGTQPGLNEMQQSYLENVLRSLANSTGGTAVFNTNNLNQGLDKVDLELSNYYVLGFNPSSSKRDGKLRKIEVKTETKGAKLKYRTGYIDPRPRDVLAGSKEERSLLSAISSPTPIKQLPVIFRPLYFYDTPTLVRVPITASIQSGAIEFKKKGPMLVNSIDVMGVAYGEDGSVAARFSETLNLAVEKEKEAVIRSQDIPYQNYLKLRPGKYQVKMAIADDKGKIGTTEQQLLIPALSANAMASSSLVITQQMSQLPELIRNIQSKLMEENDPLSYKGMQLIPDVDQIVSKEGSIAVYYKVYNLKSSMQNRHLVAKIQVTDDKGAPAASESLNLDDATESTSASEAAIGFSIPLKDLAPGKYQLTVVTQDAEQNQSVTSGTEFVIR